MKLFKLITILLVFVFLPYLTSKLITSVWPSLILHTNEVFEQWIYGTLILIILGSTIALFSLIFKLIWDLL